MLRNLLQIYYFTILLLYYFTILRFYDFTILLFTTHLLPIYYHLALVLRVHGHLPYPKSYHIFMERSKLKGRDQSSKQAASKTTQ